MTMRNELNVVIVGAGYVGLTTGVCLAYLGHRVFFVDRNEKIIRKLADGQAVVHEPGLQEIMNETGSRMGFGVSMRGVLKDADVIIIAVGTPSKENGDADTSAVERVAEEIGDNLPGGKGVVIVNKSTVPIGSARRVEAVINARLRQRGVDCHFSVASNPEFLREGAAVSDTFYPDRIVVGAEKADAVNVLRQLYNPILEQTFMPPAVSPRPSDYALPPFITTSATSAELIKYAANSFLAMKVSFINEFAGLAERLGADIREVARGIGSDKRIGMRYLEAGLGWGGSCFGKDTRAIIYTASQYGYSMELVQATVAANYRQRFLVVEKLQASLKAIRGRTISLLGLAFKPQTDDLRDAPAIDIICKLLDLGARVKVYDPLAMDNFRRQYAGLDVECAENPLELCSGSDALVLVTDWPEFAAIDWEEAGGRMRHRVIVDGRNMLKREELERAGFVYMGVGC
ncbi:MAG TPA: UDP-glucose/GDP-mannose dehydrogenase family protein [Bacillota bacterium]|nr:UDP-glucose/GDP-mannose dehydrogenase family protein [Bacillota bacterium]